MRHSARHHAPQAANAEPFVLSSCARLPSHDAPASQAPHQPPAAGALLRRPSHLCSQSGGGAAPPRGRRRRCCPGPPQPARAGGCCSEPRQQRRVTRGQGCVRSCRQRSVTTSPGGTQAGLAGDGARAKSTGGQIGQQGTWRGTRWRRRMPPTGPPAPSAGQQRSPGGPSAPHPGSAPAPGCCARQGVGAGPGGWRGGSGLRPPAGRLPLGRPPVCPVSAGRAAAGSISRACPCHSSVQA